jgi:hypothetical protein
MLSHHSCVQYIRVILFYPPSSTKFNLFPASKHVALFNEPPQSDRTSILKYVIKKSSNFGRQESRQAQLARESNEIMERAKYIVERAVKQHKVSLTFFKYQETWNEQE